MDQAIAQFLQDVETQRLARLRDARLGTRVLALKHYQQRRFARSYADLLATPRYADTARFFLEELYGPRDYSERDAQFARVVPTLVRLFPRDVVGTVHDLAELHALSERLDTAMAANLGQDLVDAAAYARAWQTVGEPQARARQIELTLAVGRALEHYTRKPLLRQALRMMRGPAAAAGMGELQRFLETGFDTFRAMKGADEFLACVSEREQALAAALFAPGAPARAAGCPAGDDPLGQLP